MGDQPDGRAYLYRQVYHTELLTACSATEQRDYREIARRLGKSPGTRLRNRLACAVRRGLLTKDGDYLLAVAVDVGPEEVA